MSLDHVSRGVTLTLCLLSPGSWVQAQQVLYDHPDAARSNKPMKLAARSF